MSVAEDAVQIVAGEGTLVIVVEADHESLGVSGNEDDVLGAGREERGSYLQLLTTVAVSVGHSDDLLLAGGVLPQIDGRSVGRHRHDVDTCAEDLAMQGRHRTYTNVVLQHDGNEGCCLTGNLGP